MNWIKGCITLHYNSYLEIKENLSRVSANLKSGFIDAVNRTWSSINDFAKAHRTGVEQQTEEITGESSSSSDVTQECKFVLVVVDPLRLQPLKWQEK